MFDNQRYLAVIPARAGSKGLPGKNLLPLGGKPLIAWSIEAALASRYLDTVIVSSEDAEILETARQWGAATPFVRPKDLADDSTPGIDVVLHACQAMPGFDCVVLLQPTSPLRSTADIDQAIELRQQSAAPVCVSVTKADKSPYWMFYLDDARRMAPVVDASQRPALRQALPEAYALNGAVYVARIDWLQDARAFLTPDTVAYAMPRERSVDIDTAWDFKLAEALIGG